MSAFHVMVPQGKEQKFVLREGTRTFSKSVAKRIAGEYLKKGKKAKVVRAKKIPNYKVLYAKKNSKNWHEATLLGLKRMPKAAALILKSKLKAQGFRVKVQKIRDQRDFENKLIETWLAGDLDCNRDLLVKLARLGRRMDEKLYVNCGKRTYAEQAALYAKYGPGRAAKPGTSNHETGNAADVVQNSNRSVNVGDIKGARRHMKSLGLGLPVSGEPWHVEITSAFNA